MVTRTGFQSKKGETVKFMLHPDRTQKFKFYSEAWTYVKIMAVIGLGGMIYNIYDSIKNEYSAEDAILGSLDLVCFTHFSTFLAFFCPRIILSKLSLEIQSCPIFLDRCKLS